MLYAAFTFAAMVVVARLLFVDMRAQRQAKLPDPFALPPAVNIYRDWYIAGVIDVEQFEAQLDRILLKRSLRERQRDGRVDELRRRWHSSDPGVERIMFHGGGQAYIDTGDGDEPY